MKLFEFIPKTWKERLRQRAGVPTFLGRLQNLRRAGFTPRRIIDAGAFRGDWTQIAHQIFPAADFLLIEAQPALRSHLEGFCARLPSARSIISALGREPAEALFLLEETNSRIVPREYQPGPGQRIMKIKVERLETVAREAGFLDCDLLKLDLQGAELDALAGAGALFGQTEIIITEASWLRIGTPPLATEVIQTFAIHGYRLYDVLGFNYRPLDGALWQTDFIFVREDSALLASNDWI